MKSLIQLTIILLLISCGTKSTSNSMTIRPPLQFKISFYSEYELKINIKSLSPTDTLIISDPSYYPITFLRVFDKKGHELPGSKFKHNLDLQKAKIILMPNQESTYIFKPKLNVLFTNYKISEVGKIKAEYKCYAFRNKNIFFADSLQME